MKIKMNFDRNSSPFQLFASTYFSATFNQIDNLLCHQNAGTCLRDLWKITGYSPVSITYRVPACSSRGSKSKSDHGNNKHIWHDATMLYNHIEAKCEMMSLI